ncbi:MAG: diguanylate cyclase (GGDEF)-like protein/PAS domain S-box-containing protein [Enterobacterales bacterium]|jgi:diguanylate cyclase (GGDEF)-like protein/PAS domain S-box-containing protein
MLLITFVWTGIFLFSLWTYIQNENETVDKLAINVIQSNYAEIDAFRHWIAHQGGVYVQTSDDINPNPALSHLVERDISTPSGKQLTLVNTPIILRQLIKEQPTSFNAHMASLDPINLQNTADEWERDALEMLSDGFDEHCDIVDYKDGIYMRLIKPARFKAACGTCHTNTNLKSGDILGGLTVSVPMQPYYDKAAISIKKLSINHGGIWFLGLVGLGVLFRHEKKHDLKRKETEDYLRQSSVTFSNLAEGVVITNANLEVIAVNNAFTEITGFEQDEMMEQSNFILNPEYFEQDQYEYFKKALNNGEHWDGEILYPDKTENKIPLKLSVSTVKDDDKKITNYIFVCSDISEKKSLEKTLQHLAQHDHLTDLPNRILLNDRLEHAMIRADRNNKKLAVLFLDLDKFKIINDENGHDVGDYILIQVSKRLKESVRKEDTLARYGGDEFIVVMEEIDTEDDAKKLASKLIDNINPGFILDDKHYKLGVSIGISIYPDQANTVTGLINNSDKAMYQAKTHGRNTYRLFSSDQKSDN